MGTRKILKDFGIPYRDHPHAYGDKHMIDSALILKTGSSPRVWGQASVSEPVCVSVGIIPTRMGTRALRSSGRLFSKDHPHAYGDKFLSLFVRGQGAGSSPRVWGQVNYP